METKFELDLDYNNVASDVLVKRNPKAKDTYQEIVQYANHLGLDESKVKQVIFSVSQEEKSSATGSKLNQEASDACEKVYEAKGADAFNKCREEYIANVVKKKEGRADFWNKVLTGIKKVGDTVGAYTATPEGQPMGTVTPQIPDPRVTPETPNTEVRILGMKPLVFTLVSLGVVITAGIALSRIGKRK